MSRTSGLSREAYRKSKIGTEVGHVTRDSDTLSRSNGQRSTYRGGGILWQPPAQLVKFRLAFKCRYRIVT